MQLDGLVATDFCHFERVDIPLARLGLTWIRGVNLDTESASSNGSGKTTIPKAIGWGLFGQSLDGHGGDSVIRAGQKMASVTIPFADGEWRIVRERRKGAERLRLFHGDDEFKASKQDTQTQINQLLGLDWNAFRNTVIYSQRDTKRFIHPTTRDADRKQILHGLLSTDKLSGAHGRARELAADKRGDVESHARTAYGLRERIEENDPGRLRRCVDTWEHARSEKIRGLKNQARELIERARNIVASAPVATALDEAEAKLRGVDLDELRARRVCLETRLDAAEEARRAALGELAERKFAAGRARDSLDELDRGDGHCPVCTSSLAEGSAKAHRERIARHLKKARRAHKDATATAQDRTRERDQAASSFERVERDLHDAVGLRVALDQARAQEEHAKVEHTRASTLKDLAREKLREVKSVAAEDNPFAAEADAATKREADLKTALSSAEEAEREARRELAHLEFWVRGFGPSGLPSFLLDSSMPVLTERTNHYLSKLSDGDISVEFATQRELKSLKGEFRDQISVQWEIEGVKNYSPSGGQWKKMEIASDLALMDLALTRDAGRLDLLCLDECLDGLDAQGRQRVVDLLLELRRERGTIFVISHDENLEAVFDRSITVRKRHGVGSLEIN